MVLSVEGLQKASATFLDFQRGKQAFESQHVTLSISESFWKGEVLIKGTVKEGSLDYHVTLDLSQYDIKRATCDCKEFKPLRGLCSHCIATALQYRKINEERVMPTVRSSPPGKLLLNQYADRSFTRALSLQGASGVLLEPKMFLSRKKVEVEFRIGKEKSYVLKDILSFAYSMKQGERVEYGKGFSFVHTLEAFDESSQPFVAFVLKNALSYQAFVNEESSGFRKVTKKRKITIGEFIADEWMALIEDYAIKIEDGNGITQMVNVVKENPKITLTLQKKGKDGVNISVPKNIFVFRGMEHVYARIGDELFICDADFSDAAGLFLDHILNQTFPTYGEFDLNNRDMPAFCREVLPLLAKYLTVNTVDVDLDAFRSDELKTQFYLDRPDDNMVTCHFVQSYGSYEFNPLNIKNFPKEIYRDHIGEMRVSNIVTRYFTERTVDGELIIQDNENAVYELLMNGLKELKAIGEVFLTDAFRTLQIRETPKISVGVSIISEIMELEIDAGGLTREELGGLLKSFRNKKRYHRLKNGDFITLDRGGITTIRELTDGLRLSEEDLEEKKIQVPVYRALYVDQILKDNEQLSIYRGSSFKSMIRNMKAVEDSDFSIPDSLQGTLRSYQKNGYRWMRTLQAYGFGGILADDMGLGKTLQVISLFLGTVEKRQPSIVICPASLIYNWESEIKKFAPQLSVVSIAASASERKALISDYKSYDVLITSYDLLRRDIALYQSCQFLYEVIDEAQYIKNYTTLSAKAVKKISSAYRFALTGTPIENRLSELWSIFDFLMPGFLYTYPQFKSEFEIPIVRDQDAVVLKRLHRLIRPFILRRLKQDVLKDLPAKTEQVIYSKLEGLQKRLYQAAALQLKETLVKQTESQFNAGKLQVLTQLTRLRQLCCDPALCFEDYKDEAAKLETCMELLLGAIESGHKVLLFSQFTSMLEIIRKRLEKDGITYHILTGSTGKEKRMELVNDFNKDLVPVFLISLKAGGTGLNLTAADIVIHFDPWWNIAAQNQATDRAHRIGQEKMVSVYRMIAKDTIEEKILKLQESKKNLAEQVLEGTGAALQSLSREELIDILS
ncbi:MAG: SNF2 helicase associated domain-containing protein [Lachnospiraceae bacterium]